MIRLRPGVFVRFATDPPPSHQPSLHIKDKHHCEYPINLTLKRLHPRSEHSASSTRDTRPQIGALLGDRAADGGTLHLTLGIDNDASVVLKVDEASTINPPPRLALPYNNRWHHLLAQFGLALLAR